MKWRLRRKLRRDMKSIRWDLIEANPPIPGYMQSGEYQALLWLKAYSEDRAAAEPRELLVSCLNSMLRGDQYFTPEHQAAYMLTLMPYVE